MPRPLCISLQLATPKHLACEDMKALVGDPRGRAPSTTPCKLRVQWCRCPAPSQKIPYFCHKPRGHDAVDVASGSSSGFDDVEAAVGRMMAPMERPPAAYDGVELVRAGVQDAAIREGDILRARRLPVRRVAPNALDLEEVLQGLVEWDPEGLVEWDPEGLAACTCRGYPRHGTRRRASASAACPAQRGSPPSCARACLPPLLPALRAHAARPALARTAAQPPACPAPPARGRVLPARPRRNSTK